MSYFKALQVEMLKTKASPFRKIIICFPLVFFIAVILFFYRHLIGNHSLSLTQLQSIEWIPLKLTGSLWAGFFHPFILALLPALLMWPEHKGKMWHHLHVQPISRMKIYIAKLFVTLGSMAWVMTLVWLVFWVISLGLAWSNPALQVPFRAGALAKMLAWLWLGSLPLLCLYLWAADRIATLAVPMVMGLIGLMLTISLSGQEVVPSWRRDLIPWVLPYFAAQQAIPEKSARQEGHVAGNPYRIEPNVVRLPSGKRVRTWQNIPDEVLFPPPPPTPAYILAIYSIGLSLVLIGIGLWDARRQRF